MQSGELPESRNVVQLKYVRHIDISTDGILEKVNIIYYYPTTHSVQENGSDSISWNTHNHQVTVTDAAVVTGEGLVHVFDPATAQTLTDSSSSVFTTSKELVLQLPGLEEGSLSVLGYTRAVDDADNFYFNDWAQIGLKALHREFILTWDEEAPVWHVDDGAFDCEQGDKQVRCVVQAQGPIQTDHKVYYADVIPRFSVAANQSWDDVVHEMRALVDSAIADRGPLLPLLDELQDLDDPFPALLELVGKNIRYVSFSEAEHAYQPHTLEHTLTNRYGDCKDKSVLLLALLQELGYESYAVLVATDMEDPEATAISSRGHFDHMIVCARLGQEERCFDPTDIYASTNATPENIQGKVRLNLVPGSRPSRVPQDEFVWNYAIVNELQFQDDGSQTEQLTRTYGPAYGSWMRAQLGGQELAERDEWLLKVHENVVNGVLEPSFEVVNMDALEKPLAIKSAGRYVNLADPKNDLTYIDGAYWIRSDLKEERIQNEHYAVETDGVHYSSTYRYSLGDKWSVKDVGANIEFKSAYGSFKRTYEIDEEAQVLVKSEVKMPGQEVEPSEFANYNRFIDLIVSELEIRFWGELQAQD